MITNEFSDSDEASDAASSNEEDDEDGASTDEIEFLHEIRDERGGDGEELFTEYEVDSDADREEIRLKEGDRDSAKESDDDSIITVST